MTTTATATIHEDEEHIIMTIFEPRAYRDDDADGYGTCSLCGNSHDCLVGYFDRNGNPWDYIVCCEVCVQQGQGNIDISLRKRIAEREASRPHYTKELYFAETEFLRSLLERVTIPTWQEWIASKAYEAATCG